ncbi:hypothetical protein D6851_05915 [Altericroceibacterium spongiae]|uniref:Uncharacterized protein n=1 Tax=Altericroceibacterium spongiae TaxID=2320269 RepID=A0A420EPX8_9SPHN|nr:hypothetical protein [Altericroceibacterium spongiae]RKF22732.1 hypothetical protein D6851_05915 [Altericroceibacterium spongiae]
MDISRLLDPNAMAAGEAVKAGREGDFSKLASRLRDPSVSLDEYERDWLAGHLLGEFKRPKSRPKKTDKQLLQEGFRTYLTYLRHLRGLMRDYPTGRLRQAAIEATASDPVVMKDQKIVRARIRPFERGEMFALGIAARSAVLTESMSAEEGDSYSDEEWLTLVENFEAEIKSRT